MEMIIPTNLAASTHMSVLLSLGDSEYAGAPRYPTAGVQIQG